MLKLHHLLRRTKCYWEENGLHMNSLLRCTSPLVTALSCWRSRAGAATPGGGRAAALPGRKPTAWHRCVSPSRGHWWTARTLARSRLRRVPAPSSLYKIANLTNINAYKQADGLSGSGNHCSYWRKYQMGLNPRVLDLMNWGAQAPNAVFCLKPLYTKCWLQYSSFQGFGNVSPYQGEITSHTHILYNFLKICKSIFGECFQLAHGLGITGTRGPRCKPSFYCQLLK